MVEGRLVEDEEVRGACEDIIYQDTEEPEELLEEDCVEGWGSAYHVMRYKDRACRRQSSRVHWLM